MNLRYLLCLASLFLVLLPWRAISAPTDSLGTTGEPWRFSLAGFYYAFPHEEDVLLAVGRADHGSLHFESRYNYEGHRTASAFVGWTISAGKAFTMELTPMAGLAFGNTRGVIPAVEMSLGYGMFDFYGEGEYLFDVNDKSGNFAYTWLELGVTPKDVIRAGLVAQRMRVFESPLVVDRGLFAQVMPGPATVSLYAFNMFTGSWFLTIGLQVAW